MRNRNPIILVEDDPDDCELISNALSEIGVENEVKYFKHGEEALNYLTSTSEQTFLILSDVNMPCMNGLEFKKRINENPTLVKKSIPFVFLSTSAVGAQVTEAYAMMAQGFFKKPTSFDSIKSCLKKIIDYWDDCHHPNFAKL